MRNIAEGQSHGNRFEDEMIERLGLIPEPDKINRWDAYHRKTGLPISIKMAQKGTEIALADIFRQATIEEDKFLMIVGLWEKKDPSVNDATDPYDNITDIYLLTINSSKWMKLFEGGLSLLPAFEKILAITDGYSDECNRRKWKKLRTTAQKKWSERTVNILRPRFRKGGVDKRGNIAPPRIQSSIRVDSFMEHFVNDDAPYSERSNHLFEKNNESKSMRNYPLNKETESRFNFESGNLNDVYVEEVAVTTTVTTTKTVYRKPEHKGLAGYIDYQKRQAELLKRFPKSN